MTAPAHIDELLHRLTTTLGESRVLRPGGAAYDDAAEVWNAAVRTRPALVARPRSDIEVAAAVTAAREAGVRLTVRGGGHDWVGRALCDGLVIDLGELRDVHVDGDVAVVGGGVRAADVVAGAASHAMIVATGTAGTVGMAGLTLGGGYGPLLGTAGLAADNLLGAEVVTADGTIVSTAEDPELLWALRGGGGNFGVVTSMRIRLHPDRGLVGGMVLFPWTAARSVLTRYAELLADPDDGLTLLIELTVVPDVGPCLLAVPVWSGDPRGADAALDRVHGLGTPIMSAVGPTAQQDLLAQFDSSVPTGMHWDIHPRTVATLTPEIIDVLVASAQTRPGPGAGIGLRQFHGAASRVSAAATAFGRRSSHVAVEISAGRGPTENHGSYREWAEGVSAALAPLALPGGYPNFLAPTRHDQIDHAYGLNATRLLEVKSAYDPQGMFTATPLPSAPAPARP